MSSSVRYPVLPAAIRRAGLPAWRWPSVDLPNERIQWFVL
jgi:hypothetical protein